MSENDSRSKPAVSTGLTEPVGLSVRAKVFLELLGFGFLPLLLVSFLTVQTVQQRTIDDRFDDLAAVAQVQKGRVEFVLQDRLEEFPPLMSDARMIEAFGLMRECTSGSEAERMSKLMVQIRDGRPTAFTDIMIIDVSGCVLASTAPDRIGKGLGDVLLMIDGADSLIQTLSGADARTVIFGDLQHNNNGDLVHPMAGPYSVDGVHVGSVVAEATTTFLATWAGDFTGLGETGETVFGFLDEGRDHAVFATPLRFATDAALVRSIPMSDLDIPIVQALLSNEAEFDSSTDYRGVEVLAVTRKITPTGWGIVVKMDRTEAFSTATDLTRFLVAANIAVLVILLVAAATLARRRTDPIRRITSAAVEIASGDLDRRVTVAVRDELGVLAGAVNEMADELVDRHRMLEGEVRTRTAQLRRTIDTLEISNRDLERMAMVSAHDLSEPLRKIRVFGGRLEDTAGEALDEKSRDYLKRMTSAAERMQGLIDGLLAYSRVTTRAEAFEWVDLGEVTSDVVADFDVLIDDTGATVEIADLPRVMGEPTQMRQLIQNLLSNSLKYHEHGEEPWVRISAEDVDEHDRELPGAICRLIVEDHGIGIPDAYLETVFDLFAHLQDQVLYPGSGLGLSVCRRILEHHGGTIVIEPNVPKGIRVIASIPVTPQRWE